MVSTTHDHLWVTNFSKSWVVNSWVGGSDPPVPCDEMGPPPYERTVASLGNAGCWDIPAQGRTGKEQSGSG